MLPACDLLVGKKQKKTVTTLLLRVVCDVVDGLTFGASPRRRNRQRLSVLRHDGLRCHDRFPALLVLDGSLSRAGLGDRRRVVVGVAGDRGVLPVTSVGVTPLHRRAVGVHRVDRYFETLTCRLDDDRCTLWGGTR